MSPRVCVIMNPASGRGQGARMEPKVRAAFGAVGVPASDIHCTTRAGDEVFIAQRLIAEGAATIVAVGGDGTWSNVANAIASSGADCRLGLIAAGTGNDFAKTVGVPARDVRASARLAVDGPDQRIDVGKIEDTHFLNAVGFGFDAAVLEDSLRIRYLRGNALYVYAALRQLLAYRGIDVSVGEGAAAVERARRLMMLVFANGQRFGGAFHIAPGASCTDGLLDAIVIGDVSAVERIRLFARAMRGTHVDLPSVTVRRGASYTVRFDSPPAYELDGEFRRARTTSLEVTCVAAALRVVGVAF